MDPLTSNQPENNSPQREKALHIVLSLNKGLSQNKIDLVNAFLEVFITNSVIQHEIVFCQAFLLAGDELNISLQREMIFGGHNPITKENLQNTRRKLFGNFPPILKRIKKEYDTYLVFITDGGLDFKTIPTTTPHSSTFTTLVAVGCQVTLHKFSTFDELIYVQNFEDMVIKMPQIENIFTQKCFVHQLHSSLMAYFPDKQIPIQKENSQYLKLKPSTPKSKRKTQSMSQPYFKISKNSSSNVSQISLMLDPVDTSNKKEERYVNLSTVVKSPPKNLLEYERYSSSLVKIKGVLNDVKQDIPEDDVEYEFSDHDKITEVVEDEEFDTGRKLEFLTFSNPGK